MDVLDRYDDVALSPVARVALAYRASIQMRGTLGPDDSKAYRAAVRTMRRVEGRERQWIAGLLRISPSAVDKLIRGRAARKPAEAAA